MLVDIGEIFQLIPSESTFRTLQDLSTVVLM